MVYYGGGTRIVSVAVFGSEKLDHRRVNASTFTRDLHQYFQYHAGTDGFTTLADGEALTGHHRNGDLQLDRYHGRVARGNRVNTVRQRQHARHVRRAKEKPRLVTFQKRRMPTALLLRQHIHLALKPSVRRNAAGTGQHLTALDFFELHAAKQYADVFACSTFIDELAKDLTFSSSNLHLSGVASASRDDCR